MTLTPSQNAFYGVIISAAQGHPLANTLRDSLLSVDLTPFNITPNDQSRAIRKYESVIGLTLQAA